MHMDFRVAIFSLVLTSFVMIRLARADDDLDFNTDDLIDSIKDAMGTLFEYVGDENGCFYKCQNGGRTVARSGHRPRANGCGAFGIQLDTTYVPAIEKCCNKHDHCYDTCNRQKDTCDDEFRDCLTKLCKAMKPHVSHDVYDGCKSTADLMYAATMTLGCKPYKDSQRDACVCTARHIREL